MASDTFRSPHGPCPPLNAQLRRSLHDYAATLTHHRWTARRGRPACADYVPKFAGRPCGQVRDTPHALAKRTVRSPSAAHATSAINVLQPHDETLAALA